MVKAASQGNRNSPSKGLIQKQQAKVSAVSPVFRPFPLLCVNHVTLQMYFCLSLSLYVFIQSKEEYSNVWQSLQNSGPPHKPPAHWHTNVSQCVCLSVCVCVSVCVQGLFQLLIMRKD